MDAFETFLRRNLDDLAARHLRRSLRACRPEAGVAVSTAEGRRRVFCSNDYLGLARHPEVMAAAAEAARSEGAGSGAARLVCGTLASHERLERCLAEFKGTERALAFSSGYATATGVIPALVGPGDCVVLDRLAHACLVDGARSSGARLRVFRHNDVEDLERILKWADEARHRGFRLGAGKGGDRGAIESGATEGDRKDCGRVLVVTESVFSMDGDRAPLREIVERKTRYGAWLMVDEAHATGLAGDRRRGVVEELGLEGRVEVTMGTLGKALGAAGGFVAGSAALVEFLWHRARSFVFSTAPPPATAAAAAAAVALVRGPEGEARVARLRRNVDFVHRALVQAGWTLPPPLSPILPLLVGAEADAMRLSEALDEEGCWVSAIRFPTVPRGRARLRVTLGASHAPEDLDVLLEALRRATNRTGIGPS